MTHRCLHGLNVLLMVTLLFCSCSEDGAVPSQPNLPPDPPAALSPPDGAEAVGINSQLSWSCGDPDDDALIYSVYLGTNSIPPLVCDCLAVSHYDPGSLVPDSFYYWCVIAHDDHGNETVGDIWNFSTSTPTQVPTGSVSGTWVFDSSPYLIQGDIEVSSGSKLVIELGVEVIFQGHYGFCVIGELVAEGTENDSIVFTAADTATGWRGICILAGGNAQMDYCVVQNVKKTAVTWTQGGAIACLSSSLTIQHSSVRQNLIMGAGMFGGGIFAYFSEVSITYCNIQNNCIVGEGGRGGGISALYGDVSISHCNIQGNRAVYGGGIFGSHHTAVVVDHNLLVYNEAEVAGGGMFLDYYLGGAIDRCTIARNQAGQTGGGLAYDHALDCQIRDCIIEGNLGSGMGEISLGTYYSEFPGVGSIMYCDFSDNEGGNYTATYPDPENLALIGAVNHENANGTACDTFHNLFLNPLFADPDAGDFTLQEWSFCIDAGDPEMPPDPDGTVADMGAFYYPP